MAPQLQFIQRFGAGYDNIDLAAARAAGVMVANTLGANAEAVAEHTVMLMLVVLKRLMAAHQETRAGTWSFASIWPDGIPDLADAVVGLMGMGHIGQAVAARLRPFGCRVVYYSRHRRSPDEEAALGITYRSWPDVLGASHIVSVHMALTAETERLFDAQAFSQMMPGAIFINTARGGVVDEAALRNALQSGHLAGAGLDVIEHEGPGPHPFADCETVVVTPHCAGLTRRSQARSLQLGLTNVLAVMEGRSPTMGVLTGPG